MGWYIGIRKDGRREVFSTNNRPTKKEYPQYIKVIGPYNTAEEAYNFQDRFVYVNPITRSQQWKDAHRKWTPEEKREYKKFLKAREKQRSMSVSGPTWYPRPVQEYAEGMYDPQQNSQLYQDNPTEAVDIPPGVSEDELEVAAEVYEKFHDFSPTKLEEVEIPHPKVLVKIGDFTAIGYFSPKWKFKRKLKQTHKGDKGQHYLHEYKDQADSMVAFAPDPGNPEYGMLIAWRRCRLTAHGLEDNK